MDRRVDATVAALGPTRPGEDATAEVRRLAARYPLQSLTRAELELDTLPLTVDPRPRAVRAWVRFGPEAVQVDAEAMRWTPRAVGIRFRAEDRELRCWVWASAVERQESGRA